MQKSMMKLAAVLCTVFLLIGAIPFATVSAAYENTHTNTGNMAQDIVAVAMTQVGYLEGSLGGTVAGSNNLQKYGQWYDNNVDNIGVTRAAWCAAFVSWCAKEAGVPSSIVKYHAYCPYGVNWFKNQGRFYASASRGGSYIPKPGDIVYFAPAGSSVSSHIGIVRSCNGSTVYTIEGNTSGQNGEVNEGGGVFAKSYSLSYSRLLGYGVPAYQDNSGHKITFDSNGGSTVDSVNVKDGATLAQPANPTKYGFDFGGWYCNPELTDPYDFSKPVTYGFTLFAKWDEAYWGANVDLKPIDGQLATPSFQEQGAVWPYFNTDGSVTLYNGVTNAENWSWPHASMTYANSFDSANDAYIYVKKDGTARFNAVITYMDRDGNEQTVSLSQLAGRGDADFDPGYQEFFVNLGQYVYDQGHLPASGNVKYTKVDYYVVGELDSYVKIYDMKLTPMFDVPDPYITLYNKNVQQIGGAGSFQYDNGILNMTSVSDNGYTVKIDVNQPFNPTEMIYLAADMSATVPYNITMDVTRADGDATLEIRREFYDMFGFAETPESLPAGSFTGAFNMNGYYYWNGGLVNESVVKSITISLLGKGDFSMCSLQVSKSQKPVYINDGETNSGELKESASGLTSDRYTVTDAIVSAVNTETTVADFLAGFDQSGLTVLDASGNAVDASAKTATGMIVVAGGKRYKIAVSGDVNGDGVASSTDARIITQASIDVYELTACEQLAADFDQNGSVSTADVRELLLSIIL